MFLVNWGRRVNCLSQDESLKLFKLERPEKPSTRYEHCRPTKPSGSLDNWLSQHMSISRSYKMNISKISLEFLLANFL
ncbi:hypothetical protein EUGRSUZ_H03840 [Eucalyptus grandis]|uniref:Uncharacterized protein n=2 Tax=Eucalyptus grandis TaxID=71139 RepID=A0ACC3JV86_EUCGR|nr:hypothetical protein EUGRSUZ_H03840 [Eucalyptus grandis]